ncbi:MAG TPA: hypothetical protein VJP85_11020 [Candidatus Baltobacteraceae bacterium]|nr:hypothetical protein [Candidatus Baltobacteraceae bacterium]
MPELSDDDSVLAAVVGSEDDIFAVASWIPNDLERLGYFALYYRERARDLVRLALKSNQGAENSAYVVGYLYRHAIELFMKSIIASDPSFRQLTEAEQGEAIWGHDLRVLWNRVKPILSQYDEIEIGRAEKTLLELHALDERSDGFRYPFKVMRDGKRVPLLNAFGGKSFDNFVWVLDALCSWFEMADDAQDRHLQWLRDMRREMQP